MSAPTWSPSHRLTATRSSPPRPPPLVINASLYSNLAYDPEKDFVPVTRIASVPIVLVVNPKTPANSVQELVALAKAKPGTLTFGSSGNGTTNHLSAELLKFTAGIDIIHVPYRGEAPAMNDLIAGQIPAMFQNLPAAMAHIESGALRALAVTTTRRSTALPNVPTMREAGFPEFEASAWFGMVAPAGTPAATIDRLYAETAKALKRPDVQKRFAELGADPGGETPVAFGAFMTAERQKWGGIIRRSGARID